MMKYKIQLFVLLCLAVVTGCNNTNNDRITDKFVFRCFLFNTSCDNYNYLIEVDKRGVMTTFTGSENMHLYENICTDVNITSVRNPFLEEIVTQDSAMLAKQELDGLKCSMKCLKHEVHENPLRDSILYDSWVAVLLMGDRQYVFKMTDRDSCKVKFIKQLMHLSKKKIRLLPYKDIPLQTYPYKDSVPLLYEVQ